MYCPNCACELPAVAKFCVRCGTRMEAFPDMNSPSFRERVPAAVGSPVDESLQSKKTKLPDSEKAPPFAYASGRHFITPRDSVLPGCCVKCGNPPCEPWLRKTFSWHHPGYYLLIISPVIYVIVALIVRKRIEVSIPLCRPHKSIRKKRLCIGWILVLGCVPLPSAFAYYIGNESANAFAIWMGLFMFLAGLFFLKYASPLTPSRIGAESAEFGGACEDFLAALGNVSTDISSSRYASSNAGPIPSAP